MKRDDDRALAVVDAHCHIDLFPDPKAIVSQAEALRIHTIAVTNAPSVFHFTREITSKCAYVHPAVGLHPELVHSHRHELPQCIPLLEGIQYVGEIGLDYTTSDQNIRALQREVFSAIVERCSSLGDKVLTIHSRRAVPDVLATLGTTFNGRSILHWFSGSVRQMEQAADAGCYFSVNPAMLQSKNGIALIQAMPRNRVITETDGPFVKVNGNAATPPDTGLAIVGLAKIWHLAPAEVRNTVVANHSAVIQKRG
ncbi:MAG TPA: Qat anti-phage system TatD family nuclease QatD [Phycisphaerae bacterium]|nr:Qat anti-phage system TatD family nuclease QatD [Phycisphaerae bacterium]